MGLQHRSRGICYSGVPRVRFRECFRSLLEIQRRTFPVPKLDIVRGKLEEGPGRRGPSVLIAGCRLVSCLHVYAGLHDAWITGVGAGYNAPPPDSRIRGAELAFRRCGSNLPTCEPPPQP
jgi:hypothetical protein